MLLLTGRAIRFTYAIGLKSLLQEEIVKGFMKFRLDMGALPKRVYTDFDHRLLSGKTEEYLHENNCQVLGSPAGRHHQNGLVERSWQTIMNMARSYLHQRQIPRTYWFWAIRHVCQVNNYFPCKVDDTKTTPLELVYGVRPDFSTLLPLFSVVYFKHARDGSRARDGTEAKVMQGILMGRSDKADGYLIYSPFTKQFYVSSDCKIDTGSSTATMFNLKYNGGLFIGLYDSSDISNGVEPYPPGTSIIYTGKNGKDHTGTVTSFPLPDHEKGFPTSPSTRACYSVRLGSGEIVVFSGDELPL